MKVTNIILSIIILLLAIALAVSSFFLYEKRVILINGWETLTTNINKTAAELDKNSGTKVADELTPEILHHTNHKNLAEQLEKLNSSAARLVKQRDNLASTLVEVSKIVEAGAKAPKFSDITTIESSENAAKNVAAQAALFKARRDAVLNSLVRSGKLIGVPINVNDLKSGNSAKVFKAFDDKINALKAQLAAYEQTSREIGRISGAGSIAFNASAYRSSLQKLKNSVQALKDKYNDSQRKLNAANAKINQLNNTVKQRDQRIVNLNKTIQKKETEVKQLKRALGVAEHEMPNPWLDGSKEARLEVKGKVIEVNEKFGFYVINIGNNTRVQQPIGKKINYVNPKINPNMKITVTRNMDSPEMKFISKGKITNVADDCSIIEVTENNNKVMVGDDVFFTADDLK